MNWSRVDVDVVWCFISCMNSHFDGTHSLQWIHWWTGDIMLNLMIRRNKLMYILDGLWVSRFSFFGWIIPLIIIIIIHFICNASFLHSRRYKIIQECVAHSEWQVFQFQVEFSYYKNSVLNFQWSSDIVPALPSKKNISICTRQGFILDIMRNYNISLSVSGIILYFLL